MNLVILLKVIGGGLSGLGSLLLAYRSYVIFNWVRNILVAHENNLDIIFSLVTNRLKSYSSIYIDGTVQQLLKIESRPGLLLLILGFIMFGLGMLMTAVSYIA
ncbi:TPA: hypothetical protein R7Q74_000619 [Acinetobacter baumannii]|nr:hypothetical protein [Acinetobacter baumannii]